MTPEQRNLARHALGLTRQKTSYRNHFVTGPGTQDHAEWVAMVAAGEAVVYETGLDDVFHLTLDGARLALAPGETLCGEDFPELFT